MCNYGDRAVLKALVSVTGSSHMGTMDYKLFHIVVMKKKLTGHGTFV